MASENLSVPSIVERVRAVPVEGAVVAAHFLGRTAVFVLGEEQVAFAAEDGSTKSLAVHRGGILATAASDTQVITGGDDGQVFATDAQGASRLVGTDGKRRWIDQVAAGPSGALAWSAGKIAVVRTAAGEERRLEAPSGIGGLAFAPKGLRLALAHYNGVTLWFPNATAAPEFLDWKGSHLDVTFSPDGRFLVTSMQENTLHGWRIVDAKHMRMSGYSGKVRSLSWTADGRFLATSGSEQVILWPFTGKDGPMGAQPRMLAPLPARVGAVACHPAQPVVAAGYADGTVMLVRVEDGAEIVARHPDGAPVSALAWSRAGDRLAFGTENGSAGVVVL